MNWLPGEPPAGGETAAAGQLSTFGAGGPLWYFPFFFYIMGKSPMDQYGFPRPAWCSTGLDNAMHG